MFCNPPMGTRALDVFKTSSERPMDFCTRLVVALRTSHALKTIFWSRVLGREFNVKNWNRWDVPKTFNVSVSTKVHNNLHTRNRIILRFSRVHRDIRCSGTSYRHPGDFSDRLLFFFRTSHFFKTSFRSKMSRRQLNVWHWSPRDVFRTV